MKNKLIVFAICFCVLLSVFTVSAFAYEGVQVGEFMFNDVIRLVVPGPLQLDMRFTSNGVSYDRIAVKFDEDTSFFTMQYDNANDSDFVYTSEDGWLDDVYKTIYILDSSFLDNDGISFLDANQFNVPTVSNGFFYDAYSMFGEWLFGNDLTALEPFQQFALSNLAIWCSLFLMALPLIAIFICLKFILKLCQRW